MKKTLFTLSLAFVLMFALSACRITQTEEGELPDIDVKVEEGNLPKYDVDGPDIDVGTKDATATVPDVDVDVDVGSKEVTIPIPDIDIKTPDDPDYEDDDPKGDG